MTRVVIVDDQDLIRAGLQAIIDAESDLTVVGQACDGAEAVRVSVDNEADVVLMDIQMPGTDGIAGIEALVRTRPAARIIVLTMYDVDDYVFRALKAGASGFLMKTTAPEDLTMAIRDVYEGRRIFAPAVTDRLVRSYIAGPVPGGSADACLRLLSTREREVFDAIARGLSNAEIGRELFLSEATVKTYVTRILAKLELRDRVQAVILAYESGAINAQNR